MKIVFILMFYSSFSGIMEKNATLKKVVEQIKKAIENTDTKISAEKKNKKFKKKLRDKNKKDSGRMQRFTISLDSIDNKIESLKLRKEFFKSAIKAIKKLNGDSSLIEVFDKMEPLSDFLLHEILLDIKVVKKLERYKTLEIKMIEIENEYQLEILENLSKEEVQAYKEFVFSVYNEIDFDNLVSKIKGERLVKRNEEIKRKEEEKQKKGKIAFEKFKENLVEISKDRELIENAISQVAFRAGYMAIEFFSSSPQRLKAILPYIRYIFDEDQLKFLKVVERPMDALLASEQRRSSMPRLLPNLGNTCYKNASYQMLFDFLNDRIFVKALLGLKKDPKVKKNEDVEKALKYLFTGMESGRTHQSQKALKMLTLLKHYQRSSELINNFGGAQEDPHEYLVSLFSDLLFDESIAEVFKLDTVVYNKESTDVRETTLVPFLSINGMNLASNIQSHLDLIFQESDLETHEGLKKTKKQFNNAPRVIFVHLARFNGELEKDMDTVNLAKSISVPVKDSENATLNLRGIIAHEGINIEQGHYVYLKILDDYRMERISDSEREIYPLNEEILKYMSMNSYILAYQLQ